MKIQRFYLFYCYQFSIFNYSSIFMHKLKSYCTNITSFKLCQSSSIQIHYLHELINANHTLNITPSSLISTNSCFFLHKKTQSFFLKDLSINLHFVFTSSLHPTMGKMNRKKKLLSRKLEKEKLFRQLLFAHSPCFIGFYSCINYLLTIKCVLSAKTCFFFFLFSSGGFFLLRGKKGEKSKINLWVSLCSRIHNYSVVCLRCRLMSFRCLVLGCFQVFMTRFFSLNPSRYESFYLL